MHVQKNQADDADYSILKYNLELYLIEYMCNRGFYIQTWILENA